MYLSLAVFLCLLFTINYGTSLSLPDGTTLDASVYERSRSLKYEGPCDEECGSGCWGPGPQLCHRCKHFLDLDNNSCVKVCDNATQFARGDECRKCDDKCDGCESRTVCVGCKGFKRYRSDGFRFSCVSECAADEYVRNKVCRRCHRDCRLVGCTGRGKEDCKPCDKPVVSLGVPLVRLLHCSALNDTCPESFFETRLPLQPRYPMLSGIPAKRACIKCHRYCTKCTGFGFNREVCQECVEEYKNCSCPSGSYLGTSLLTGLANSSCIPCSAGCTECTDATTCL